MEKLKVYLDTNVYSYLYEAGEGREAHDYFREIAAQVLIDDLVILETARVPGRKERLRRLQTVRTVGKVLIEPPTAYREAMEVLGEIRRCRPTWLRPNPDEAKVKKLLRLGPRSWRKFKYDRLPNPALALPRYLRDAEPAAQAFLAAQRQMRQTLLKATTFEFRVEDGELQQYLDSLGQSERYWRLSTEILWATALNGETIVRDLNYFLGPYLAPRRIERKDWASFWFRDVDSAAMPTGRLRSAVEFHQLSAKITHGNGNDVDHGLHLADCDLLLTCDRNFFKVLGLVVEERIPSTRLGRPVLVPRLPDHSALEAIRAAIEEAVNASPLSTPDSSSLG